MSLWVFILCLDSDYLKMELCTPILLKYMGCFLSHPWLSTIGLMNPVILFALAAWKQKQFLCEHFMQRSKGQFLPILMHITSKLLSRTILVNCLKLLQIQNEITSFKMSNIFRRFLTKFTIETSCFTSFFLLCVVWSAFSWCSPAQSWNHDLPVSAFFPMEWRWN